MGYFLGVDIGTTYTAAAVWRDGRCDVASLGNRAPTIPSVVFLRDDGTVLDRRGGGAAGRVRTGERRPRVQAPRRRPHARHRRGHPLLGRCAHGPPAAVRSSTSSSRPRARPPDGVAVTHPANWGPYKLDLLAPGHPPGRPRRRRHRVRARGGRHPLRLAVAGRARRRHRRLRPGRRHLRRRRAAQDRRRVGRARRRPRASSASAGSTSTPPSTTTWPAPSARRSTTCRPTIPPRWRPPPGCGRSASTPRRRCPPTATSPSRCCCRSCRPRCGSHGPSTSRWCAPPWPTRSRRSTGRCDRRASSPATSRPCCWSAGRPARRSSPSSCRRRSGRPVAVDAHPKYGVALGAAITAAVAGGRRWRATTPR